MAEVKPDELDQLCQRNRRHHLWTYREGMGGLWAAVGLPIVVGSSAMTAAGLFDLATNP